MDTLTTLFDQLAKAEDEASSIVGGIKAKIQTALNAQFDDWQALQSALTQLEQYENVNYAFNQYGDVEAWIRFDGLTSVPEDQAEYLERYLSERCVSLEPAYGLTVSLGPDEILIQGNGHREPNRGCWQSGKMIIDEASYIDEQGEVDTAKRNQLIEAHMERTGYFPGVFETTSMGDLIPINTQEGK